MDCISKSRVRRDLRWRPSLTARSGRGSPAELAKRFGVHAEMTGLSKSARFAELVRAGCKRFVVSDRERGPGEPAAEVDAA